MTEMEVGVGKRIRSCFKGDVVAGIFKIAVV